MNFHRENIFVFASFALRRKKDISQTYKKSKKKSAALFTDYFLFDMQTTFTFDSFQRYLSFCATGLSFYLFC